MAPTFVFHCSLKKCWPTCEMIFAAWLKNLFWDWNENKVLGPHFFRMNLNRNWPLNSVAYFICLNYKTKTYSDCQHRIRIHNQIMKKKSSVAHKFRGISIIQYYRDDIKMLPLIRKSNLRSHKINFQSDFSHDKKKQKQTCYPFETSNVLKRTYTWYV